MLHENFDIKSRLFKRRSSCSSFVLSRCDLPAAAFTEASASITRFSQIVHRFSALDCHLSVMLFWNGWRRQSHAEADPKTSGGALAGAAFDDMLIGIMQNRIDLPMSSTDENEDPNTGAARTRLLAP
jgi:hypothetical protein